MGKKSVKSKAKVPEENSDNSLPSLIPALPTGTDLTRIAVQTLVQDKTVREAFNPALGELGNIATTVVKSVNAALMPFRLAIWAADVAENYIKQSVSEKLKDVPAERIIAAAPEIQAATYMGLQLAGHSPELREMYVNLLATAMDSQTAMKAHPAFAECIRQMTPDEQARRP